MGILRTDRVAGLGGANAISGSVFFGRNGLSATASGNWLTLFSEDDFKFGTGDFTIEAWIYYTGTTSGSNSGWFQISNTVDGINNSNTASAGGLAGDFEGGVIKGIGNNGWFNGSVSVTAFSWIHVAMVRHSGTLQWFVNGAADTSASDSNDYSLTHLAIGGYYTTSYLFNGYISNFRVQKGKAEYTAAFTPPTTRLEKTPETVVLACQSPGNILQEATGKTLSIRRVNTNDAPPQASHFTPNSPVGFSTTSDVGTQFGSTFDGVTTFDSQAYFVPPGGNTRERNRGRALLGGGHNPSGATNHIHQLSIQSQGNTEDFGDLTYVRWIPAPSSSSTRGVWSGGGGYNPGSPTGSYVNFIDFVTIANSSNATDFGDQTAEKGYHAGLSNETRGIIAGGYNDSVGKIDVIEFITIATAGNAQDFGDLTAARMQLAATGSPTRGLFFGGEINPNAVGNVIDFITIATTGNAQDFGDMTAPTKYGNATSSNTRAVYGGGLSPDGSTYTNKIEFVTIATTGNGTDFGDLITAVSTTPGATSNNIRGIIAGGYVPSGNVNSIEFVTIASTGNASDFGDITQNLMRGIGALSDGHGGLE